MTYPGIECISNLLYLSYCWLSVMYLIFGRTTVFFMILLLRRTFKNAIQNLASIILYNLARFPLPILVKCTFCYIFWWNCVALSKNISTQKSVNLKKNKTSFPHKPCFLCRKGNLRATMCLSFFFLKTHEFRVRQVRNFFVKRKQKKYTHNTSTWNMEFSLNFVNCLFTKMTCGHRKIQCQTECASRGFHI